jgi:hypothetical protein
MFRLSLEQANRLLHCFAISATVPPSRTGCLAERCIFNYRKLCGYTNVQGRQVNGGLNTCHASVERATGRFIHMEQDWHVLKSHSEQWSRLYENEWPKAILESFSAVVPMIARAPQP